MSCFNHPNFAKEFALRTKYNYYQLMARTQPNPMYLQKVHDTINELEKELIPIEKHSFEITQLVNSLIGLLIIPQQEYLDYIREVDFDKMPILQKYVNDPNRFKNDYKKIKKNYSCEENGYGLIEEESTPGAVLKHMRNAAGHNRLEFYPKGITKEISDIIFSDHSYLMLRLDDSNWQYSERLDIKGYKCIHENTFILRIKVSDFEPLLFEIADCLTRIQD